MSKRKNLKQAPDVTKTQFKTQKAIAHVQEAIPTKLKMAVAAALAALAMLIYSPSFNYDFVYDDDAVVKDNRFVKQGLAGLGKIWTTSYFRGFDETMNARAYRPVPLTTLAIEYELFGLNATVNHIFNLLFYGLTAFFLFLFLSKLLRNHHPALPILTCLLFVLHPIHLEVVANIKSRDTMLGFLHFVLAGWFLLKHLDNRKLLPLALSLLFYAIALFSKEEIITSVALIPLMLYFFRDYQLGKIALATAPYAGLAVLFIFIRSSILGGVNEGVELTALDNSLLAAKDVGERTASTIFVLGHYLLKTIFPHPLISDYSYATLPLVGWGDYRVYLSLIGLGGLLSLGLHGLFMRRPHGYGALHFFVAVSIFSSIVVPNVSAYNDRFLYIPVLGICYLLAYGLVHFLVKKQPAGEPQLSGFFKHNFAAVAIVALVSAISIFKIESHLPYWRDRFALFEHDAKRAPNNARMRKNHGGSLARRAVELQQSDPAAAREFAAKAIQELDAALAIFDRQPTGHIHKGNMYIILQQYGPAEESLKKALQQNPGNYFALVSLGNVLYRQGKYQEAIEYLEMIRADLRKPNENSILTSCYEKIRAGSN